MAEAATAKFEELVIEVEFDPTGSAGTYSKICGMKDFSIARTNNTSTDEVPDCADESLPFSLKRFVTSQDMTISGTGKWALSSHQNMMNWYRNATTLNVRVTHQYATDNGDAGVIDTETVPMILASVGDGKTKGQTVEREISLEKAGAVTYGTVSA